MEATRAPQQTVIEPPRGWGFPNLRELWEQRDLLYFMSRRDIAVRYKQSVFGVLWALIQPLTFAAVFSLFFGLLVEIKAPQDIPYPLFAASGMVLWVAFADGLQFCSLSMVTSSALISKIYFPRLVIPTAAITPAMLDLIVGFLVMIAVAWGFGYPPDKHLLIFPVVLGLTAAVTLGTGLWFAALNVKYRDIVMVVPFITLVGLFVSPLIYPITEVPVELQPLYAINPMSGILELWRFMLLPTPWPSLSLLLIPVTISIGLLTTGLIYFRRAEPNFADLI
jgi:lipopolysaccharide transport system permease protein